MATTTMQFRRLTAAAWSLAAALLLTVPSRLSAAGSGPDSPSGAPDGATSGAPIADERASYSFLRTLEGAATVAAAGQGVGEELEVNQPLLTGDRIQVGPRARVELALADRNRLYLDAESGVVLERLAFSGDREERTTVLRLEAGELLLEVSDDALGDELPRVITGNATIYVQQPGQYRVEAGVEADGQSWTRVVTRRGYAEIVTDRGSSVVREDEAMTALGDRWTRLELAAADGPDAIERWSAALGEKALAASRSARYVEPHLAYDAAPLDQAGDWVEYESVRYWRPYVSSGWRPYWQGRWSWTPSGYTWISYEPWGWVPYHYGRWCSLPGYGWAWRPGAVYSPAWVYWNWTSGWAGWVPMGYYSHFYDPWDRSGFRYGVYGWAGGGWGIYSEWNFAPVHCFRDRRFRGHMRTGRDLEHETRLPEPPRGLLTTDTRDFRPDRIDRTEDLLHQIGKRNRVDVGQELPDVTDFVGRKGRLPTEVARVLVPDLKDPTGPGVRYDPKGRSDRGVIRDVGDSPKISETPGWKGQDQPKSRGIDRSPSTKGRSYGGTDSGRKGDGVSAGSSFDKPGTESSKGRLPTGTASSSEKSPITKADPRTPETKAYGTGKVPAGGENRQQWKEKGGETEPVQKVVGSVRRPVPGGESKAPSYGQPKSTERYEPSEPYRPSGKGSPGSQGSSGSQSYGKGSAGSQGSSGSQSYGKGSAGSQGSSGSQSYGKGSAGSQGSSGSQSYGKSSSAGSQRSQPSGRAPATSSGSKGQQSSPPPPPPKKEGDGGH